MEELNSPAQNVTPPPIPAPDVPTVPVTPAPTPQKRHFLDKLLLILLLLGIISGAAFYLLSKSGKLNPGDAPNPTPTPASYTPPTEPVNSMLYLRDPDINKAEDYEAWLVNAAGKEEKLALPAIREAYKYYGDSHLYYLPVNNQGQLFVKDLASGTEVVHTPVTHPDPTTLTSISLQNLNNISPDGKYAVLNISFYQPCPSPSPFPSGFEGGFGPCGPEENLAAPTGYYLYDLVKKTATHLNKELVRVERWDTVKQELYYASYGTANQTFKLSLSTMASTPVDLTMHFGYFAYPLKNGSFLKHESAITPTAFGKVSIFQDGKTVKTLAESDKWAELQPFLISSPDERYLIWIKSTLIDSIARYALYAYDSTSDKTTRITPEGDDVTYNIYVTWLDDHTLVTAADPIEKDQYVGNNKYLLKIDLSTGESTRLTTTSQVAYFNTQ